MHLLITIFMLLSSALSFANSPNPTTTVDKMVSACGPFELWLRTQVVQNPDGTKTTELRRVWTKLHGTTREIELRETSNFRLTNRSETLGCEISAWHSGLLNADGDFLSVVNTCGQFVQSVIVPAFMVERILYIFKRDGEVLKKVVCRKPPKNSSERWEN